MVVIAERINTKKVISLKMKNNKDESFYIHMVPSSDY